MTPRRVAAAAIAVWLLLAILSVLGQVHVYVFNGEHLEAARQLDFDKEANLPTLFHTLLLVSCGVLLAIAAVERHRRRAPYRFHWALLAAVFFFLAIDEVSSIHNLASGPLRNALDVGGVFYNAWIIPAAILVVAMALAYVRFLAHLPRRISILFITAAAIYLGGVIFLEGVGGYVADSRGQENLTYAMITQVEEAAESIGLIMFLYALVSHLSMSIGSVVVRLRPESVTDDVSSSSRIAPHANGDSELSPAGRSRRLT